MKVVEKTNACEPKLQLRSETLIVELPALGSSSERRGESGAHFIPLTIPCQQIFKCEREKFGGQKIAMQFDLFRASWNRS